MYLARPTQVLRQFLEAHGTKPRTEFDLGRLAMALEIITVVKTLEDELVPMLTVQRQEIISVLETLLRDQRLEEVAKEWYEQLNLWRRPKFVGGTDVGPRDSASALLRLRKLADAHASHGGGLQHALVLAEGTRARLDERQSPDLPSDESDPGVEQVDEAMQSGLSESLDETDESRAEFLRQSRSRHGTGH